MYIEFDRETVDRMMAEEQIVGAKYIVQYELKEGYEYYDYDPELQKMYRRVLENFMNAKEKREYFGSE
jgi:hypothetical protein